MRLIEFHPFHSLVILESILLAVKMIRYNRNILIRSIWSLFTHDFLGVLKTYLLNYFECCRLFESGDKRLWLFMPYFLWHHKLEIRVVLDDLLSLLFNWQASEVRKILVKPLTTVSV